MNSKSTSKAFRSAVAVMMAFLMVMSTFVFTPATIMSASASDEISYKDPRLELDFNNNWKFNLGEESGAYAKAYDDSAWETVELPHDFSIIQEYTTTGTDAESGGLPGGIGWYRKMFILPTEYKDRRIIINFEGAYNHTEVYVNGTLVGENHYGYNAFSFDITDYVDCNGVSINFICVRVENKFPSSRWYSGSGLYRDVTMTIINPVHVDLYGTYVTMPNLETSSGADGTLNAKVTLANDDANSNTVTVETKILDASGAEVGTSASAEVTVAGASSETVTLNPALSNPNLWSTDSPYLYTLRTTVTQDGTVIDEYDTDIGYRWINWEVDTGFYLNGEAIKLQGVCMHHDQGALGAVQVYDALYRQIAILKDMGVNSIRTSHNTPSDILMDICNEQGMLVMNEFFDGWDTAKNSNTHDFSEYFDTEIEADNNLLGKTDGQMWYEFVLTQSVKRDRNDPCIVIWDVGNEIAEGASVGDFGTIAQNMRAMLDALDPTRPICDGNNQRNISSSWPAQVEQYMTVIGGNYAPATWAGMQSEIASHADAVTGTTGKPFVMTETTSALSTRGNYSQVKNNSVLAMTADSNKHITAYDSACVSWGTTAAGTWYYTITNDWFSGQYVWTGFDYIGEPTPYNETTSMPADNPNSSYFGIIDTAGFEKDTFYLYRSWWNDESTTLHIVPGTWDASELDIDSSGYVDVGVYSNADKISLLLDGSEIGYATAATTTTAAGHSYQIWTETATNSSVCNTTEFYPGDGNDFYPQFHVKQSAGSVLTAKAYRLENGSYVEITDTVGTNKVSAVSATQIVATQWGDASKAFTADGDSYVYIEYEAQDANGNFDATYDGTLKITVNGDGATIVGVDNGNQATTKKFQQPSVLSSDRKTAEIQMLNGKALAVIRTNENVGEISITTTDDSSGYSVNGVTVTSAAETGAELSDEFEEIVQQPEDLVYVPTIYDEYQILKANIEKLGGGEVDYTYYPANPDGTTAVNMDIPDGWYIITGTDDQGGTYSKGVMTHTAHASGGFVSDGSTGVPAETSDMWYFEKTTGGYYIYYTDDNGVNQYLSLSNNTVTVGTSPYVLEVTTDSSGNVTIGFGSTFINYHGGDTNRVWYYSTGTNLSLYYVSDDAAAEETVTVAEVTDVSSLDGEYIITGADGYTGTYAYGAMTHTATSNGLLPDNVSGTPEASDNNTWIFEQTSGGYYIYYVNSSGAKVYLTVTDELVSTSTTATVLTVTASGSKIVIGDSTNTYQINYYGSGQTVSEWNPGTELTLYEVVTSSGSVTEYVIEGQVTDSAELAALENGWYILKGAGWGNVSTGAITHTVHSSGGLQTDSTSATADPTSTENVMWYFERQSNGTYYVYYLDDSGTKQYMNLTSSTIDISTTPQALTVTASGSTITIGASNGYYVDFCGNSNHAQHVATWTSGTSIYVYKVNEVVVSSGNLAKWIPTASDELLPPVENGGYVIYNLNYILSNEAKTYNTSTGVVKVAETPSSSNVITTYSAYEYTFTLVDGTTNQYYIQNSEGKYLVIGSSNSTVSFSDTPTELTVYGRTDGTVNIYSGSYFLDNHQDAKDMFGCWSSSISGAGSNQIFTLYRNESGISSGNLSSTRSALLSALTEGVTHAPGVYSTESYQSLFDALEEGYALYNNAAATDAELTAATDAINAAIAGLSIEFKYIPSTIYKYGYNPSADSPYSVGGEAYNVQTIASLKAMILADDNLVAQIKETIEYDTRTDWGEGMADNALEDAVDAYAEIYSLLFTGYPVTGDSDNVRGEDINITAWNRWTKENTQGADEDKNEGASVQGLFSALLVDGLPADHADYASLPYANKVPSNANHDSSDGYNLTIYTADSSTSREVNLPALEGMSVHINDMFAKEEVLSNDTTQGYSKFYWDLSFPLVVSTNEYGINTYNYSSSNESYLFQATFDDDTNTATAQLTPVEEWSINLADKGAGKGFFPFNYQNNTTTLTGENAVYHFGMSFTTDFYIPLGGTYADGEDVIFNFSGDDDVLVYIDDVLVLDNGGLHGKRGASINFTNASVTYQYAMDVAEGEVKSTTEYGTTYTYGEANDDISADNLAALAKLNEVRTDGDHHTFTFYYLERGSTDSNCEISFNIQQISEDVKLNNQTLVIDYGHPVTYDITSNNYISEAAQTNAATVEYVGITASNTNLDEILRFDPPDNLTGIFSADNTVLNVEGLNYGTCSVNSDGELTFTPSTVKFTGRDYFYSCAKVTNDPTYSSDTEYYQYERTAFIPATSIYFEDNYSNGISFTDGATASGFDNSSYEYGVWKTVGTETAMTQAADLADDDSANPYGYDPAYDNCTTYSAYSSHVVSVSEKNNPKSSISGGTGASWPTMEFEFSGTGFDIISLTDSKSGVFYLDIYDETGARVGKKRIVDNYYGYSYGKLYADANGETTLEETAVPFYNSILGTVTTSKTYYAVKDGSATQTVTYYDVSGNGYTETPTYYDADGNLTETVTEKPAYAYNYAYGWLESDTDAALYQVPVMKINDLEYGNYRVVITCAFTDLYKHYETDANGNKFYNLYIDAIRIYDPAGKDDGIADDQILQSFKDDKESYPNYLEIKDMLIGANTLSQDASTQGVIFIDGIAASDNDLEMYKKAGPNNELYLAQNQAVAFEIWATAVPDDVQIGVKSATGAPVFTVSYGANTVSTEINSATEMYRSINSVLPVGGKLAWTNVQVGDVTYYTSGVVVIQNTSAAESVLSLTNMKWTFTGAGAYGHYAENYDEATENLALMSNVETQSYAYTAMSMRYADLEIGEDDVSVSDNITENDKVVITIETSTDVSSLVIKDANGKLVTPESVSSVVKPLENEDVKEWTVILSETGAGTYTYTVSAAYENGYTGDNEPVTITVTVSAVEEEETTWFEKIIGFFRTVLDFFAKLLSNFGIKLV